MTSTVLVPPPYMGFEVFRVERMWIVVFWAVRQSSIVGGHQEDHNAHLPFSVSQSVF
jgi:hypothetical protein